MNDLQTPQVKKCGQIVIHPCAKQEECGCEIFFEDGRGGKITGYFGETFGVITDLYVKPESRGKGYATKLVQSVLKQMQRAGIKQVYSGPNEMSQGVLENNGFEPSGCGTIMVRKL